MNDTIIECSPTTLRYIKVLHDIVKLYDTSDIKKVAEIGVGYGGQARIIMCYLSTYQYDLYDLSEVLELAERFLLTLNCSEGTRYINGKHIYIDEQYDLVISNYAFSELYRDVQDMYLSKVILKSRSGYITWNSLSCELLDGYTVNDLLKIIPNSYMLPEEPITAPKNCIIVWGTK